MRVSDGSYSHLKIVALQHAARNLEDQDWVKSLQVIEHTMVHDPERILCFLISWLFLFVSFLVCITDYARQTTMSTYPFSLHAWLFILWYHLAILQVPIIRLKAHILPHQCELGDISLSVKETCPMGTSSDALDGSPTSQGSGDSAGKEGPWGSEKDRQIVCLDISFEAPTNTGLRTSELVISHSTAE